MSHDTMGKSGMSHDKMGKSAMSHDNMPAVLDEAAGMFSFRPLMLHAAVLRSNALTKRGEQPSNTASRISLQGLAGT